MIFVYIGVLVVRLLNQKNNKLCVCILSVDHHICVFMMSHPTCYVAGHHEVITKMHTIPKDWIV
jgi:hypothetical protein